MSDKPKAFTLDLNRGAARLLAHMLSQPGWCKDTSDSYRAGVLLENDTLEVGRLPKNEKGDDAGEDAINHWLKASHPTFELTEKQRDTCKRCIEHHLKGGAVHITVFTVHLQRAFGLTPED